MKRKSLPEMFMIASVLTDGHAEASLELPTQLDPILPSAMRAQLEAAVGVKSSKASTASKAPPVIAALPSRKATAKQGASTRRSRAWIPVVAFVGIGAMTLFAAVRNGAYFAAPPPAIVEPAAQAPQAPPLDPVVAAALALPSTPATPVEPTNEPFDVPVSVPAIARTPVITVNPRGTQQGTMTPRVDPPKAVAVAAVPQPSAPIAKPTAAPTDAPPAKAKADADFEAAMRAAQRANQQLDTTLR